GFHETQAPGGMDCGDHPRPRRGQFTMIRPLGDLFEADARLVRSGVETLEEFRTLLLALQDAGDRGHDRGRGQHELVHAESLPARPASYGELAEPLPRALAAVLDAQEIMRLYSHQAQAIDLARAGKHVVVATGTASGKSLAYHIPVLERLLLEKEATALYLFPTKALAQDQLRGLLRFADASRDLGRVLATGPYDGDTP